VCSQSGDYEVAVKFNDEPIPDSPFTVYISEKKTDSKKVVVNDLKTKGYDINKPVIFTAHTNGAKGKLDTKIVYPSGQQEKCVMQEMHDDHFAMKFVPIENGIHWIHVLFNGHDVPESPFKICIGQISHMPDAGRVLVSGEGLHKGDVGKMCEFSIDTSHAGVAGIAVTAEGPTEVKFNFKETIDGYKVR
jgi:filamin